MKKSIMYTILRMISFILFVLLFLAYATTGIYTKIILIAIFSLIGIFLILIGWVKVLEIKNKKSRNIAKKDAIFITSIIVFLATIITLGELFSPKGCSIFESDKKINTQNIVGCYDKNTHENKYNCPLNSDELYKSVINAIVDNQIQVARDLVSTTDEKNSLYDFIRDNKIQAARNYIKYNINYANRN